MAVFRVPVSRYAPSAAGIRNGLPVSGTDWSRLAHEHNWLAGRGRQVLPAWKPDHGQLSGGGYTIVSIGGGSVDTPGFTEYTYGVWMLPTYAAIERRWGVLVESALRSRFSAGSVSDHEFSGGAFGRRDAPTPVEIREELASQSSTGAALDVTIGLADDSYVHSIGCYELPRHSIEDNANERGCNPAQLVSGQPITYESVERLYAGQADNELGKRVLNVWAVPYEVGGSTSTAYAHTQTLSTWQDVHAAPIPALGRKDGRSDTVRTVKARALAWEAGTSPDGELRLVSSSGGNGTAISVTGTTPTWTSEFTITVDAEDLTETTGMPGGSWDDVHVEAREVGTGTLYVASIVIYE